MYISIIEPFYNPKVKVIGIATEFCLLWETNLLITPYNLQPSRNTITYLRGLYQCTEIYSQMANYYKLSKNTTKIV